MASPMPVPCTNSSSLTKRSNTIFLAGGTHHSAFSYDITAEYWDDFAEMTGIEFVHINKGTTIPEFKKELRMNEVYYMLNKALK